MGSPWTYWLVGLVGGLGLLVMAVIAFLPTTCPPGTEKMYRHQKMIVGKAIMSMPVAYCAEPR